MATAHTGVANPGGMPPQIGVDDLDDSMEGVILFDFKYYEHQARLKASNKLLVEELN